MGLPAEELISDTSSTSGSYGGYQYQLTDTIKLKGASPIPDCISNAYFVVFDIAPSDPLYDATLSLDYDDILKNKFLKLAEQWRNETGHFSNMLYRFMNKNYQQIIALGPSAIPILLHELEEKPDHWFWALEVIANVNPVKQDHAGRIDLMARDWLEWGKSKGYFNNNMISDIQVDV